MEILHEEIVNSTNKELKERIEKGSIENFPIAIVADYQEAGKGIGSNKWCSLPSQNALFTVAFKPAFLAPENQFLLNLVLSMSLIETLAKMCAQRASFFKLKWPNDVYLGEKKLGGILFEVSVIGSKCELVLMGTGININQTDFPTDLPNPVSLQMSEKKCFEVKKVYKSLIDGLEKAYVIFENETKTREVEVLFEEYKQKYFEKLLFFGEARPYVIQGKKYEAALIDIDKYGNAKMKTQTGEMFSCGLKELQYVFEK